MNFLMKIPHDKMGHAIAGVLVFLLALLLGATIWIGMGVVLVVAVAKEIYDYFHRDRHTPDVWDAVATVSLAGLVTITIWRITNGG